MRELSVAIRVVAAFAGLLVGLATILQIPQQVRHNALTGLEPLRRQRLDEVAQATADPTQRRSRVAADGVLDQRLQGCW
jgi:hypothetical protein